VVSLTAPEAAGWGSGTGWATGRLCPKMQNDVAVHNLAAGLRMLLHGVFRCS